MLFYDLQQHLLPRLSSTQIHKGRPNTPPNTNTLSGFICISLPAPHLAALDLPPLLPPSGNSQDPKGTAYHLTLDAASARHPVTTGISAHDRAYVARLLARSARHYISDAVATAAAAGSSADADALAPSGTQLSIPDNVDKNDFTRPGHMVTLRYTAGGVRERRGHTESAVGECGGGFALVCNDCDVVGAIARCMGKAAVAAAARCRQRVRGGMIRSLSHSHAPGSRRPVSPCPRRPGAARTEHDVSPLTKPTYSYLQPGHPPLHLRSRRRSPPPPSPD